MFLLYGYNLKRTPCTLYMYVYVNVVSLVVPT